MIFGMQLNCHFLYYTAKCGNKNLCKKRMLSNNIFEVDHI